MRDSAFWMEGVLRVSEPMRIGKHEWRLVLYRSASLHYVGVQGDEAPPQGRWVDLPCRRAGRDRATGGARGNVVEFRVNARW